MNQRVNFNLMNINTAQYLEDKLHIVYSGQNKLQHKFLNSTKE